MPCQAGTGQSTRFLRCRCFELRKNFRGHTCEEVAISPLLLHFVAWDDSMQAECTEGMRTLRMLYTCACVHIHTCTKSVVTGEVEPQTILSRMTAAAVVQRCCWAHTAKQRSTQQTKGRKTQASQRRRKAVPVVGLDIAITAVPYVQHSRVTHNRLV